MNKDKFALQVTPELMLKLSRENSPETPRSTKQAKPLPSKKRPVVEGKEAERAAWLPAAPVFPGFLPTLPGPVLGQNVPPKQIQEQDSELAKIRKLLDDSERIGEALQHQEKSQLDKVKKAAQELQDKQYKAPSRTVPCLKEKDACIRCYSENIQDPLRCAKNVEAFERCSRQAQQAFVAANS